MQTRSLLTTQFKLLAVGIFTLGVYGCGGGSSAVVEPPGTNNPAAEKNLARSNSPQLVAYYQDKLRLRAAQGLSQGAAYSGLIFALAASSGGDSTGQATTAVSGTNIQEAGVDEDDLIKADADTIYTLDFNTSANIKPQVSRYVRSSTGAQTKSATVPITSADSALGLHYSTGAKKVVAIAARYNVNTDTPPAPATSGAISARPFFIGGSQATILQFHNNDAALSTIAQWQIDGSVIATRLVGTTLYAALSFSPNLVADQLPPTASSQDKEAAFAAVTEKDILPTITIAGVRTPLLTGADCYLQNKNASTDLAMTILVAIDLNSVGLTRTARCFAGGSEAVYMTPQSLYLATTRYKYESQGVGFFYPVDINTDIHKFTLVGGTNIDFAYKGSGVVPGHLGWGQQQKSYRFSEYQNDLRVLTFTGQTTGWFGSPLIVTDNQPRVTSPAKLSVLREGKDADGAAALQVVGAIPNTTRPEVIGKPGEQIYAVRYVGSKAYVVTFLRTDPLYVIDLANSADPKVVGALEIPGFSDYLLPIGDSLLLGVGHDADQGRITGVKIGLYDVSNPAAPREVAQKVYGGRGSFSGIDYSSHGLNFLQLGSITRVTLPIQVTATDSPVGASGLYRFEIDSTKKSLTEKPALGVARDTAFDLYQQRAMQIGDSVYYYRSDTLTGYNW
jgi:uncharacterized secreted protein with C-terminal beta-propeller domain